MGKHYRLDCIIQDITRDQADDIFNLVVETVELYGAEVVGSIMEEDEWHVKETADEV